MWAFDCESLGLDVYHGARPFFLTMCNEHGEQVHWEWDVDPSTRRVEVPVDDLDDIQERLFYSAAYPLPLELEGFAVNRGLARDTPLGVVLDRMKERGTKEDLTAAAKLEANYLSPLVAQNCKFDVAMMKALYQDYGVAMHEPWDRLDDTLIAGHLLASNKPHDLTSMALQYLGTDIEPYEKQLEDAVKKARSHCQRHMLQVRIAKAGLAEMPSAKEKTWKYDAWLPRWLATQLGYHLPDVDCSHVWGPAPLPEMMGQTCRLCNGHHWHVVLRDYANADSSVTIMLWGVMRKEMRRRELTALYEERRKLLRIAHDMEWQGVSLSRTRLDEMKKKYMRDSQESGQRCVAIAEGMGYELDLPRSGNNNSLKHFCFGTPVEDKQDVDPRTGRTRVARHWLNLPVVGRTDTGQPSFDKKAFDDYLGGGLAPDSVQYTFIRNLADKRLRDTAIAYMDGYGRFWLPTTLPAYWHNHPDKIGDWEWYILHPSLNITGTDTLRWSSSNPNSQNVSKREGFNLRYCFGPLPGREWWSLDAKNIELRIPFYKAGETELIDLFEHPDDAPYYGSNHLLNFHTIYEDLWNQEMAEVGFDKVGPHCKKKYAATYYQWCKNMGFAIQYGCQEAKADATAHRRGAYNLIKKRFAKLAAYNEKWIAFANRHGYVETVPDASVDPLHGYPVLCSRSDDGHILPTVPLNYHVQSTACWWTGRAMARVTQKLDQWREKDGFDGRIVMQVHDEIVLDLPKKGDPSKWNRKRQNDLEMRTIFQSTNLWRIEILRKLMARGGDDIGVPIIVGSEYHPVSWDEGVTLA